jgi:hypothetical protein
MVQPQAFQAPPNKFSNQFDQRFTPSQFDASGVTPDPDPFGMSRPIHSTLKQPADALSPNLSRVGQMTRPATMVAAPQSLLADDAHYATIGTPK